MKFEITITITLTGLKYFELFLPTTSDIPKELTHGLWREEFMTLWESFGNRCDNANYLVL
jgi:hypothetical protein